MTTILNRKVQYRKVDSLASFLLRRYYSDELPMPIKPILTELAGGWVEHPLIVNTYNQFADTNGLTVEDVPYCLHSEDACIRYYPDSDLSIIYYNKSMPRYKKTWNIAHELGHFFMRHHVIKLRAGGYLTEQENKVFEEEANYFAKQLLAPYSLVEAMMVHFDRCDRYFLYAVYRSLFGLSKQASRYASDNMATYFKYMRPDTGLIRRYAHTLDRFSDNLSDPRAFDVWILKYANELNHIGIKPCGLMRVSEIMDRMDIGADWLDIAN